MACTNNDTLLLNSIDDIPELRKDNIHIKNKLELLNKLNKVIKDGHKKLQIVTDFDHTLTRHNMDNGETVLTSFGMFSRCPSIPQCYRDAEIKLSSHYKPIEVDPVMSVEEKTQHMIDWYLAANKLLKGVKFPKQELIEAGNKMVKCFRIGVEELFSWSQMHQVPVLVLSAGLGESVNAALKAANFLLPNVKVVSNFLDIDESDTIVGIKGPVIHTLNKNEAAIKNTVYYEMVKERENVLLMGDNIGDTGMAEGMDHCDVIIKIGFLGRNAEPNLQNYLNKFDIVLVNDPTMDVANAILRLVL